MEKVKNRSEHLKSMKNEIQKAFNVAMVNKLDIDFVGNVLELENLPLAWLIENCNTIKINFIYFDDVCIKQMKKYIDDNYLIFGDRFKIIKKDVINVYTNLMKMVLDVYSLYDEPERCIRNIVNKLNFTEKIEYKIHNKVIIFCGIPPKFFLIIRTFINKIHLLKFKTSVECDQNISFEVMKEYIKALNNLNELLVKRYFGFVGKYKYFFVAVSTYINTNNFKNIYIDNCTNDELFFEYFKKYSKNLCAQQVESWDFNDDMGIIRINIIESKI